MSGNLKYIKIKRDNAIITFPANYNHAEFARRLGYDRIGIASAGFVMLTRECNPEFKNPGFSCYGSSFSLNLKSDPEVDSRLMNIQVYGGSYEE